MFSFIKNDNPNIPIPYLQLCLSSIKSTSSNTISHTFHLTSSTNITRNQERNIENFYQNIRQKINILDHTIAQYSQTKNNETHITKTSNKTDNQHNHIKKTQNKTYRQKNISNYHSNNIDINSIRIVSLNINDTATSNRLFS